MKSQTKQHENKIETNRNQSKPQKKIEIRNETRAEVKTKYKNEINITRNKNQIKLIKNRNQYELRSQDKLGKTNTK